MMKKAVISLLLMTMLAGCVAVPQEAVPTPSLTVDNAPEPTATSNASDNEIKSTRTLIPSTTPTATRILPLQKVLLTSYFDSPTPIFDAAQAVTVTPAKAAVCPEVNPDLEFDEGILTPDTSAEEKLAYILNFLNQGGSMEIVLEEINKGYGCSRRYYGDLNGDEVSELMAVFYGEVIAATFELIGCTNGKYDNLHTVDLGGMTRVNILMIEDMNLDGLPEVLLQVRPNMGTRFWLMYQILGWDDSSFKSLVSQTEFDDRYGLGGVWWGYIGTNGLGGEYPWEGEAWEVQDIDQNGTLELILRSGIETHEEFIVHGPHQPLVHVYTWNGEGFVLDDLQIGPPEYRFQDVHNGDLYTLLHEYEQAEASYRQAIDDPSLLYWMDNSVEYFRAVREASYGQIPTPTPSAPDVDEYPNLAAYPAGQEGHIFVQLAERLLGEYRALGDVRAACAEVVAFAALHENEALQYVGGYHGWQTLEYEVEDVCPFR